MGNHKHRAGTGFDRWHLLDLPFLDRLADAGVTPELVDLVVCTHLHIDHVGWNTRWDGDPLGTDVPQRPLHLGRRGVAPLAPPGRGRR